MKKKKFFIKRGLLIFISILLIAAAVVPLMLPSPESTTTELQFEDKDSHFIKIDNVNIHYKTYGNGEPYFILLHGTLMTSFTWNEIVGPLAKMGTVIAYDRPSFGLTSRPMPGEWDKVSPYGYENQVEMLIKLMDLFKIKQAILIGSSMGGAIAGMTAQKYPDRVAALVLDDSVQSRHGIPSGLRILAATPQMRKIGPIFLNKEVPSFADYLYKLSWHDPSKIKKEYYDEYFKILNIKNFDRGLWELIAAAKPFEELLRPDKITVPTLVIAGDDDRIAGVKNLSDGTRDIIKMSSQIPNSQMVVIPKCGHLPQEECPEQFMKIVKEFVLKLPPSK